MDRKIKSDLQPTSSSRFKANDANKKPPDTVTKSEIPGYMRSTSAASNKRATPMRSNTVSSGDSALRSARSNNSTCSFGSYMSKKTSTPMRAGGKLDFSDASSIGDAPAPIRKTTAASRVQLPVVPLDIKRAVRQQKGTETLPCAPLRRVEMDLRNQQSALSDDMKFEINRSKLICALRLEEKAKAAHIKIEKQATRMIWNSLQMSGVLVRDTCELRSKNRQMQALLPVYAKLQVFLNAMNQAVALKNEIEDMVTGLVTATRDKVSILPFKSEGMEFPNVRKMIRDDETALKSQELKKLPLVIETLRSYQILKKRLENIATNSKECFQLLKQIKDMDSDFEKYRIFAEEYLKNSEQFDPCMKLE